MEHYNADDKIRDMMNKYATFKLENNYGSRKNIKKHDSTNMKQNTSENLDARRLNRAKSFCEGSLNAMRLSSKPDICCFVPQFCCDFTNSVHSKFENILNQPVVDLNHLRKIAWNGVPDCCRQKTWQILAGILGTACVQHDQTLAKKRDEYRKFIEIYFQHRNSQSNSPILRQIIIDIPRTFPLFPLFQNETVQSMYERILYIWAVRHPASSYVQGINDLVGPIIYSTLYPYFGSEVFTSDPSVLDQSILSNVEADCFWLLTKLLDNIIDNYTPDQPGIQTKIQKIRKLVEMFDPQLYNKLSELSFHDTFICYKWINNLFVRDLSFKCTVRLWDTLWAQQEGFDSFVIFICGAFFKAFAQKIYKIDEHFNLILFFQDLPTSNWDEDKISVLLAESYLLYTLYNNAISRLK